MNYDKDSFRFLVLLSIVSGLALISFSCNYFTEPNPEVNKGAHSPQVHDKNTVFNNYSVDQIVAGTINPTFIPDWGALGTDSIIVFIDSIRVECLVPRVNQENYNKNNPFIFSVNTSSWPDGKHHFMLFAYKMPTISDSIGLLSLKHNTLYIYKTSLVFNNTAPTAPTNVAITSQNGYLLISWTPTNLVNFHSYVIRRDGKIIGAIYSQQTSSFIDSTLPDFYRGYYEIGASNGPVTAYSPRDAGIKGQSLGLNFTRAIDNVNDQVIFNLSNNNLVSVSTLTGTVVAQCYNNHDGIWAKNINSDTLYCWDQQGLYTYDARTLSMVRIQESNIIHEEVTAFTVGPGTKFFVAVQFRDYSQVNSLQSFLNILSGYNSVLGIGYPHAVDFGGIITQLNVSLDGKAFLAYGYGFIYSYSIDSDSITLTASSRAYFPYPDWKNSRIFVINGEDPDKYVVETMDIRTLNRINTFNLPNSIRYTIQLIVNDVFANSAKLYVAYNIGLLAEYDINTQQFIRSWTFQDRIHSLLGSDNGRYLFACTSTDQWIIDIGGGQ